jgi:hypothetical protein
MVRNPTEREGTKMLRLTPEHGLLHLTADLRNLDCRSSQISPRTSIGILAAQMERFPLIEDVVDALDRIASRVDAS